MPFCFFPKSKFKSEFLEKEGAGDARPEGKGNYMQ